MTRYTYEGREVTAAEMLGLVRADTALALADADEVGREMAGVGEGGSASEARALSAMEYGVWALQQLGFRDPISDGRDPWDGMTLTAPGGGQIQIIPVDPTEAIAVPTDD